MFFEVAVRNEGNEKNPKKKERKNSKAHQLPPRLPERRPHHGLRQTPRVLLDQRQQVVGDPGPAGGRGRGASTSAVGFATRVLAASPMLVPVPPRRRRARRAPSPRRGPRRPLRPRPPSRGISARSRRRRRSRGGKARRGKRKRKKMEQRHHHRASSSTEGCEPLPQLLLLVRLRSPSLEREEDPF